MFKVAYSRVVQAIYGVTGKSTCHRYKAPINVNFIKEKGIYYFDMSYSFFLNYCLSKTMICKFKNIFLWAVWFRPGTVLHCSCYMLNERRRGIKWDESKNVNTHYICNFSFTTSFFFCCCCCYCSTYYKNLYCIWENHKGVTLANTTNDFLPLGFHRATTLLRCCGFTNICDVVLQHLMLLMIVTMKWHFIATNLLHNP